MKRKRSGASFTSSQRVNWKISTKTKIFDPDDPTTPLARGATEMRVFMGYRWPHVNPEVGSDTEMVS